MRVTFSGLGWDIVATRDEACCEDGKWRVVRGDPLRLGSPQCTVCHLTDREFAAACAVAINGNGVEDVVSNEELYAIPGIADLELLP